VAGAARGSLAAVRREDHAKWEGSVESCCVTSAPYSARVRPRGPRGYSRPRGDTAELIGTLVFGSPPRRGNRRDPASMCGAGQKAAAAFDVRGSALRFFGRGPSCCSPRDGAHFPAFGDPMARRGVPRSFGHRLYTDPRRRHRASHEPHDLALRAEKKLRLTGLLIRWAGEKGNFMPGRVTGRASPLADVGARRGPVGGRFWTGASRLRAPDGTRATGRFTSKLFGPS